MVENFPKFLKIGIRERKDEIPSSKLAYFLSQMLNFSFEIVHPRENVPSYKLKNGTWTGVVGMLNRGECDISLDPLAITEDRSEIIDFTFPFYFSDVTFLTNKPKAIPKSFAIFLPFTVRMWALVAIFVLTISFLFYAFVNTKRTYLDSLFEVYGSLLQQSLGFNAKESSKRILVIFWLFAALILASCYKGILLSFLTVPFLTGVRNREELAKAVRKGTYISKSYKNSYLISIFRKSTDESLRIIGDSMLINDKFLMTPDQLLQHHQAAYINARIFLTPYKSKYYLSDDSFFLMFIAGGVPKSFCCKSAIDEAIVRIVETGLYAKLFRDRDTLDEIRYMQETDTEHISSLFLKDLWGAFFFLFVGYFLGLIGLLTEIILSKIRTRRTLKKKKRKKKNLLRSK